MNITLETVITKPGNHEGAYVSFPTTRKEICNSFSKAGIPFDNWEIADVKTSSDIFSKVVLSCHNLSELNLLGFWMNQLDETEFVLLLKLTDAGCAEETRIDDLINLAANIKTYQRLDGVSNEKELGKWYVSNYLNRHYDQDEQANTLSEEDFEEIGIRYATVHFGRFIDGAFYSSQGTWAQLYAGEPEYIPAFLQLEPLDVKTICDSIS